MKKIPSKKQKRLEEALKTPRDKYITEGKYPWLPALLDAYNIIDKGDEIELESITESNGRKIACSKGCSACCLNPTVPINQVELQGLSWYVSEVMDQEIYDRISPQLLNHDQTTTCCFLLDGVCTVYPVRPIACRTFHVFDKPCEEYEDVSKTRPEDIAHSHKQYLAWLVAQKLMPHLGAKGNKEKLFDEGFMVKNTRDLHTFGWEMFKDSCDKARKFLKK
jgi:Predicted Fe-S-cluster oxidoreductase